MATHNKQLLIASLLAAVVLCFVLRFSGAEDGDATKDKAEAEADAILAAAEDLGGNKSMSCMETLEPCQDYLEQRSKEAKAEGAEELKAEDAKPTPECCDPMKEVVAKEVACLCILFKSPTILESFNVTQDKIVGVAKKCGSDFDPSKACSKSTEPSESKSDSDSSSSSSNSLASPSGVYLVVVSFLGLMIVM